MTRHPRILVLGASGQVGHELRRSLADLASVEAPDHQTANLSEPETLRALVRRLAPDAIVNAAAYTQVDKAEQERDEARVVNAEAPGVLAEEADRAGACIVQYSTDYVYDGRKPGWYVESDATNPLSVYGATKLAGERALSSACSRHLVFRTSWVFGAHGKNFLKTVLRLAAERPTIKIVSDQHGAPTSAALIAAVTLRALETMLGQPADDARWGVYHLAAAGEATWNTYARYVIARARERGMQLMATPESVIPISATEYGAAATRPANSRLNTTRLRTTFSIELPDWTRGVDDVLRGIATETP